MSEGLGKSTVLFNLTQDVVKEWIIASIFTPFFLRIIYLYSVLCDLEASVLGVDKTMDDGFGLMTCFEY